MPNCLVEERADRPAPAEGEQQQVAGDHRRQDQRQVDEPFEQRLAPELARAPAASATGDAERQAGDGRPGRDLQADSRTAVHSSAGAAMSSRSAAVARRGQHREALLLERRLAPVGVCEIVEEGSASASLGIAAVTRHRIDDRRVAVLGEGADDLRPWARRRRRCCRRCRAAPRRATPAAAPRARSRPGRRLSATPSQTPSFSSAALPYLPAGTESTWPSRACRRRAAPARSKPWPIVDRRGRILAARPARCVLPSRLTRVSALIRFLLREIVHPVEVGGDEDVGRRALLDLLGQRRARGIGDRGALPVSFARPRRPRRARSSGSPRRRPPRRSVPGRAPAPTTAATRQAEPTPSLQHTDLRIKEPV